MAIPKIIYSDKILDRLSIFMKIGGITLWPWVILRERYRDNSYYFEKGKVTVNHETIHIKQQQEMLVIPFYLWYGIEFLVKLFVYGNDAYRNLSFEREAYTHEEDMEYLKNRKFYSWIKYL